MTAADTEARPEDRRALKVWTALHEDGSPEARRKARELNGALCTADNVPALEAMTYRFEAWLELKDLSTKAVSDASWDGSASRFTDEQWQRSCALDRKVCGGNYATAPPKSRCGLPILEPGGALNRSAVHAAAAALGGGRGGVKACPAAIAAAKRRLRTAYGTLKEDPPSSIAG